MRERDIEAYLVKRVKALGGDVRKVNWIGHRGAPDRIVMFPGRFMSYVELKAPGKKVEAHQLREHAKLRECGAIVDVIDSLAGVDELVGDGLA